MTDNSLPNIPLLSSHKHAALLGWMNGWVQPGISPGMVIGVWHKGKEVFCEVVDKPKDVNVGDNSVPPIPPVCDGMKRDSLFRIYSMTKPITIVAALICVERGLFSLDDPLEKFIPEFANPVVCVSGTTLEDYSTEPARSSITIRHLMMHTTGISYGIFGQNVNDQSIRKHVGADSANWFRNTSIHDLCIALAKCPLMFHPGTAWHYGLNTDILGYVIALVSKMTLEDFMQKEIFDPLGMVDTAFNVRSDNKDRLVPCHVVAGSMSFMETTTQEPRRDDNSLLKSGGGGLVSTLDDYYRFCSCLINKGLLDDGFTRLISEESVCLMTTNHLPAPTNELTTFAAESTFSESVGPGIGFGLGVSVMTRPAAARGGQLSATGEFGWGGVANTSFYIDPENELICILMTQLIPSYQYPIRLQLRYLSHSLISKE